MRTTARVGDVPVGDARLFVRDLGAGPHSSCSTALLRRFRANVDADGVVLAREIEERLYDETWRLADYDVIARLRHTAIPTLLLHGDRDFIPVEVAEHVAAGIPGATLTVLANCGHFAFLAAPDEVRESVAAFVGRP